MKFEITNRFTGAVQFTAEIEADENTPRSIKIGLAVRWAIKTRADLYGADLSGAYLSGVNLYGADLSGVNLYGADLSGVNLSGVNLYGADLSGAYLSGVKWRNGITINKRPVQIFGLRYDVTILDAHMQIGCELHRLCEWESFSDEQINQLDGRDALRFWRAHKDALLAMARADERDFSEAEAEAVKS